MTDLRRLLHDVAPEPADLDPVALQARVRSLERRRRVALSGTALAAVVAVAVALALPGRGRQDVLTPADPGPAATASAATSGSPTPAATPVPTSAGPAFPADTRPDTATGSGRVLAVTGIRVAAQDGYDRVVLDLAVDRGATPGWRVEYVDAPAADGSGAPLVVAGRAYLQVVVTGVDPADPEAQRLAYRGGPVTPAGTALVRQVVPATVFEGQAQFVIGTSARTPFRVFRLSDPARVVVDVRR